MKGLSKSRYTLFCQCEKALWLKAYKPEEVTMPTNTILTFRFEQRTTDFFL